MILYPLRAMSSARSSRLALRALAALVLSAVRSDEQAGGRHARRRTAAGRGKVDDPRTHAREPRRLPAGKQASAVTRGRPDRPPDRTPPGGPYVQFAPTPGAAQGHQIAGSQLAGRRGDRQRAAVSRTGARTQRAEKIENCLASGRQRVTSRAVPGRRTGNALECAPMPARARGSACVCRAPQPCTHQLSIAPCPSHRRVVDSAVAARGRPAAG